MKNGKFEKGDWVRVWSLQSFFGSGFINGAKAFISQSQIGDSVFVCVERKNKNGGTIVDERYEVYARQCEILQDRSINEAYIEIMKNKSIS